MATISEILTTIFCLEIHRFALKSVKVMIPDRKKTNLEVVLVS